MEHESGDNLLKLKQHVTTLNLLQLYVRSCSSVLLMLDCVVSISFLLFMMLSFANGNNITFTYAGEQLASGADGMYSFAVIRQFCALCYAT